MSTSQGACLVTSAAIEPSTRVTPWTRRLPTTIFRASSRVTSSHMAAAGLSRLTVRLPDGRGRAHAWNCSAAPPSAARRSHPHHLHGARRAGTRGPAGVQMGTHAPMIIAAIEGSQHHIWIEPAELDDGSLQVTIVRMLLGLSGWTVRWYRRRSVPGGSVVDQWWISSGSGAARGRARSRASTTGRHRRAGCRARSREG